MSLDNYKETAMEYKSPTMLNKSWNEFKDYQQNTLDALPLVEDKLMSLLCAVNTDFNETETEPDSLG